MTFVTLIIFFFSFLFVTTDDVCKGVVCGKGTCKPSNQSAFFLFDVNAILGGSRLTLALPKTSSFYLVWFPIVRAPYLSNPNGLCVREYMTTIPHTAKEFVDELLCICITE